MKILRFTCILFFGLSQISVAAQKKEDLSMLRRDLTAYQNAVQNFDLDIMLDLMPPKLFDIVPREMLKAQFEGLYKDEEFGISNMSLSFDPNPKIKKAGKYKWSMVDYEGAMTMTIRGERDSTFGPLFLGMMKLQFGSDNVKMANDSTFDIAMKNKKMVAYKDPDLPTWKFLEDKRKGDGDEKEEDMARKVFENALPPEVVKAVKKKK